MSHNKYIFQNKQFIGNFEEMYQSINDPWSYLKNEKIYIDNHYKKIKDLLDKYTSKNCKVLDIGCGFGLLSKYLYQYGYKTYGLDISFVAIKKAKKINYKIKENFFQSEFLNYDLFKKIDPDVFLLSDVSWYVLPHLKNFINFFKKQKNKIFLHMLEYYSKEDQKYGKNYFYDLNSTLKFFNLDYLHSETIRSYKEGNHKGVFVSKSN